MNTVPEEYIELTSDSGMPVIMNELGMEFIYIPSGEFMMGASPGDNDASDSEKPTHKVRITEGFYMGKYQVTIKDYMKFVNETKSNYPEYLEEGNEYNIITGSKKDYYKEFLDNENNPIVGVSWSNAVDYAKWLSKKEGKICRLPTEAEWEYAARAGSTTKYYFGDDASKLGEYAWFDYNSFIDKEKKNKGTQPVGQKKPNQFGLYDMLGNVWEWVEDWYDSGYYQKSQTENPKGPETGSYRVHRGGSWYYSPAICRVSHRDYWDPGFRNNLIGFRLVLSL